MKKAHQAEFQIEIPDTEEPPPPLFVITAIWTGRGPMHGARKFFKQPYLTITAATTASNKLKPEWKKRRIYKLN